MYKVLIVDNEKAIQTGLQIGIDWNALNCTIIGCAENGVEALEIIRSNAPDILLCDVFMEKMDGLSLCSLLQKTNPEIRCILITGYQEFSTAYTAANQPNIIKMILKPTSVFRVTEAVQEAIAQIQTEEVNLSLQKTVESKNVENLQLRRTIVLSKLISSPWNNPKQIMKELEDVQLDLSRYYSICVRLFSPISPGTPSDDTSVRTYIDKVLNNPNFFRLSLPHQNTIIIALVSQDEQNAIAQIESCCRELTGILDCCTEYSSHFGISELHTTPQELPSSIKEAEKAAYFAESNAQFSLIQYKDIAELSNQQMDAIKKPLKVLLHSISSLDTKKANQYFDELRDICISNKYSFSNFCSLCLLICNASAQQMFLYENPADYSVSCHSQSETYQLLFSCVNFDQLYQVTQKEISRSPNQDSSVNHSSPEKLIADVENYIRSNYKNDLSLESIATVFYISQGYLSRLFKTQRGINITAYIQGVRMERAKSLALTSKMRAYEIANEVGISDPVYFSKLFKKITGYGIRDFRATFTEKES